MFQRVSRIPHASDPGSIPGCNIRRIDGPLPYPGPGKFSLSLSLLTIQFQGYIPIYRWVFFNIARFDTKNGTNQMPLNHIPFTQFYQLGPGGIQKPKNGCFTMCYCWVYHMIGSIRKFGIMCTYPSNFNVNVIIHHKSMRFWGRQIIRTKSLFDQRHLSSRQGYGSKFLTPTQSREPSFGAMRGASWFAIRSSIGHGFVS